MLDLNGSFADLDDETRLKLSEFLSARNEYLEMVIQLNNLRVRALANPTAENESAMNDFASAVMAPKRTSVGEQGLGLLKEAVNLDGLKDMLPMMLMGAMQFVNLPLLLTILNADPDMIKKVIGDVSSYLKKGM